ncbi:MAG: metallophosphoesterase family protein [Bacteroidetes bacterium]|nr:metallophosphoesterase family protein [Bacteroidota bacterium]
MTRILLISDTHSWLDPALIKHIEAADEVWHAGDVGNIEVCDTIMKYKPLKGVYGNIDGAEVRKTLPENAIFPCESVKVFITHIGGYPGRYNKEAKALIEKEKPKLFICGHSHILKVMYDKEHDLLHMNPGACGIHGFHHVKTALRFVIDGDQIRDLAVIELGKRA